MRTLALLTLMAVAGRAEVIRYYLHDATIGDDPNHAVNAVVSGVFDYDTLTGALRGGFSFADAGVHTALSPDPLPSTLTFVPGLNGTTGLMMLGWERYVGIIPTASVYFTQAFAVGVASINLDLQRSFVTFSECLDAQPGGGGCGHPNPVATVLRFNSGFVSTQQFVDAPSLTAPVANPEPSTLILSATCGCLLAWKMRRRYRRP